LITASFILSEIFFVWRFCSTLVPSPSKVLGFRDQIEKIIASSKYQPTASSSLNYTSAANSRSNETVFETHSRIDLM